MSKVSKIFLLLMYMFFISPFGNAELMGGHDRQRLLLIFQNALHEHFQKTPIAINAQIFPVRVVESSFYNDSYHIFNVLTEEGALTRKSRMENTSEKGVEMSRVIYFENPDGIAHPAFTLGVVDVQNITGLEDKSENSVVSFRVEFVWQLDQPAEWIWAPDLNSDSRIQTLKLATGLQQTAHATLSFKHHNWLVQSVSDLY